MDRGQKRRVGMRQKDYVGPSLHFGAKDSRVAGRKSEAIAANKKSFGQNNTIGRVISKAEEDLDVNKPPESDTEESDDELEHVQVEESRISTPHKRKLGGTSAVPRKKHSPTRQSGKTQEEKEDEDFTLNIIQSVLPPKKSSTYSSKSKPPNNTHGSKANKVNKEINLSKTTSSARTRPETSSNSVWRDTKHYEANINANLDSIAKDFGSSETATAKLQFKQPPKLPEASRPAFRLPKGLSEDSSQAKPIFRLPKDVPEESRQAKPVFRLPKGIEKDPKPDVAFRAPREIPAEDSAARLRISRDIMDVNKRSNRRSNVSENKEKEKAPATHKAPVFRNPDLKSLSELLGQGDAYNESISTQVDPDIIIPSPPDSPLSITSSLPSLGVSSPSRTDANIGTISSTQTEATVPSTDTCPICSMPVSAELMSQFTTSSYLPVSHQFFLHKLHATEDGQKEWSRRSYPDIDWNALRIRLAKMKPFMTAVIEDSGDHGYRFRQKLKEKLRKRAKTFKVMDEMTHDGDGGEFIGYMGPKGARLLQDFLINAFSSNLRDQSTIDPLIPASGGVTNFIQVVLLPEVAVQLVIEDMETNPQLRSGWGYWKGTKDLAKRGEVMPKDIVLPPPPPRGPMDAKDMELEASKILEESADLGRFLHEDEDDEGIQRGEVSDPDDY